jgi:hypothetical protein
MTDTTTLTDPLEVIAAFVDGERVSAGARCGARTT